MGRWKAWGLGVMTLLLVLAAWSRISTMKEPAQIIKGAANGVAALFKGALK